MLQEAPIHFRLAGVRAGHVMLAPVGLSRPVRSLSRAAKAAELQRVVAEEARLAARKVEVALGLAADSRADRLDDPEVDEFFVDELAVVLNCSRAAATGLYQQGGGRWPSGCRRRSRRCGPGSWTGRGPGRSRSSWASRPTAPIRRSWPRWRPRCCPGRRSCRSAGCARRRAVSCSPGTPPRPSGAAGRPSGR